MKFFLALVISICLALATSTLLFTEEPPTASSSLTDAERAALSPKPEPFTLASKESDSPATAKFKAALRLLNAYTVTMNQIRGCGASVKEPDAKTVLANFHSRNGTVMAQIMRQIKQGGGLTPEIRERLDARAAELIWADPRRGDCQAQLIHIANGGDDLYKAAKYSEDYKILRTQ